MRLNPCVQTIALVKSSFSFHFFQNVPEVCDWPKIQSLFKKAQFPLIVIVALVFSSCQKEVFTKPAVDGSATAFATASLAPTVDAGTERKVVYPSSTSTLCGSGWSSTGPVTCKWSQVGDNSVTIARPTQDTTNISGLTPGVYTFVLTVTDKNGSSASDTTFVTVLKKMLWTIGGVSREALVHLPQGTGPAPVIFAFHGHGEKDISFVIKAFEVQWPQALVVYPQGLPTQDNKPGWQTSVGEVNTKTGIMDQDLKFFDAMLSTFENNYNANPNQVFAHGWSNGGQFVYNVLWAARGSTFAALCPAASLLGTTIGKKTIPVMHVAGTSDPLVGFTSQQKAVQSVRALDLCSDNGTPWATGPEGLLGTHYSSSISDPVLFLQYDGGHDYPLTVSPLIVKFFKQVAAGTIK
jgi:predicted esterase